MIHFPWTCFLGCQHEVQYGIEDKGRSDLGPSGPVSVMTYNMEALFRDCVRTYVELTGHNCPFRKVSTPFLPEDQRQAPVSKPASDASESSWSTCPWCKHQYVGGCAPKVCTSCSGVIRSRGGIVVPGCRSRGDSFSRSEDSLARKSYYPAFPGKSMVPDSTNAKDPETEAPRELNVPAARILMKIMYGARMARQDLLRAVCVLARMLTRWDEMCDKRLLRLVSYINSTLGYRLRGWIGDKGKFLEHHSFSDADFAGCVGT